MEHKRGLDLDELEVSGSNLGTAEREMNVRFCFATRSETGFMEPRRSTVTQRAHMHSITGVESSNSCSLSFNSTIGQKRFISDCRC